MVTQVEPGAVCLGNTRLPATVVLWAAGVAASPLGKALGAPVDRAGRVPVSPDLSLPGRPEVFVIGDLAAAKDEKGNLLPGVAPVAIQQGRYVAKLIREEVAAQKGVQARPAFHYWDKGSLATIGRAAAVADIHGLKLSGFVAWATWLVVHLWYLVGFQNRLLVIVRWSFSFITHGRGSRLITNLPGQVREPQGLAGRRT